MHYFKALALAAFSLLCLAAARPSQAQWTNGAYHMDEMEMSFNHDDESLVYWPNGSLALGMFGAHSSFSTTVPHAEAHTFDERAHSYVQAHYIRFATYANAVPGNLYDATVYVTADATVNGQGGGLARAHTSFGPLDLIGGSFTAHFESPSPHPIIHIQSPSSQKFFVWAAADGLYGDATADESGEIH